MAESTHSGGQGNRGPPDNPEHNAPTSSQVATLSTDGSQLPSRAGRFKAQVVERVDRTEESMQRMGKNVKRGLKTFLGIGKPTNQGEGTTSAQDVAGSAVPASDNANAMGGLDRDGKAAAVAEPSTLSSGAAVGLTLGTEEALGDSIELETEASLPQPSETALGIAVTLVLELFKGPPKALLKMVNVVEVCVSSIFV